VKIKLYNIVTSISLVNFTPFSKNNNTMGKAAHNKISFKENIVILLSKYILIMNLEKLFITPESNNMVKMLITYFLIYSNLQMKY